MRSSLYIHCPKTNLYLRINTDIVMVGVEATVNKWFLLLHIMYVPKSQTYTVASAPAVYVELFMQIIKLCLAQCWNFSIPLISDVGIPEAGNRNLFKMIPALKVFHKNPLFLYLISSKPTIYFNETVFNRNIISLFVFSRTGSVRTNVWNSEQCKSSWIRIQANTIATKKSQNPY